MQVDDNTKSALYAAAIAIGSALATWIGLAIRRAVKNFGRTDVEIAQEDLEAATKAEEEAVKSGSATNKSDADKRLAAAKTALDHAKRLQAVADAIGDTSKE